MCTHKSIAFLIKLIIIVHQAGNMHQAFHAIFQFHEHAKGCHAANNAIIFLANMVSHIFAFFQLHRSALSIGCGTLANRGMVRYDF